MLKLFNRTWLWFLLAAGATFSQRINTPDTTNMPLNQNEAVEVFEIDGKGAFTQEEVNVNDTLSYIITIEWTNPKVPITVLAPESLTFAGLKKTKVYTSHKKIAHNRLGQPVVKNKSQFIFNLKAEIAGSGKASSTKLPYFSALRQDKEYVTISPQLINIGPAVTPFFQKGYVRFIFALLGAALLGWVLYLIISRLKAKPRKPQEDNSNLMEKLKDLKSRIGVAESKNIILEMESLATLYLKLKLKTNQTHFASLLNEYYVLTNDKNKESWQKLVSDFELAKFGGGNKPSHQLMESYKLLNLCINQKEETND